MSFAAVSVVHVGEVEGREADEFGSSVHVILMSLFLWVMVNMVRKHGEQKSRVGLDSDFVKQHQPASLPMTPGSVGSF